MQITCEIVNDIGSTLLVKSSEGYHKIKLTIMEDGSNTLKTIEVDGNELIRAANNAMNK